MPRTRSGAKPYSFLSRAVAAFFRDQALEDLSFTTEIAGQPLRDDETGWCYFADDA